MVCLLSDQAIAVITRDAAGRQQLAWMKLSDRYGAMKTKLTLAGLALMICGALIAAACSPVRAFDTVMPKDDGSRTIASGIAYGKGPRRKLDIYAPVNAGKRPLPVIMFIYGGSWANGTREGYHFAARALAAAGFVTIVPDYRLVPEVLFPGFIEDCAAAVRWVRAHARQYGADPDRIVLVGHSAGAYNAAMLALDPQFLGRDHDAIRGFAGMAGPYDFLPLDGDVTSRTFGRWPRLDETQPIHYASAASPPVLLLHGGQDDTVWPRNSIHLDARLRSAGASSELKIYRDLGHVGIVTALARPFRDRAPVLADITRFARRVTKVEPPQRPSAAIASSTALRFGVSDKGWPLYSARPKADDRPAGLVE
jgi:acetyl esterase/lipase